jgi:hypothetical protein
VDGVDGAKVGQAVCGEVEHVAVVASQHLSWTGLAGDDSDKADRLLSFDMFDIRRPDDRCAARSRIVGEG